jgi:hypothetical protein
MQWKQYLHQKPLQVLYLILALLTLKEIIVVTTLKDKVSPIADGYSEANTIRGATSFIDLGITNYSGLPDTCYGPILPETGRYAMSKQLGIECTGAYTHYPPGPEYFAWFAMKIFGKDNWRLLRLLPITLSVLAGIFFINTFFVLAGGGTRGLILGLMMLLPPMYTNYMHGLHHQQYAFLMFQTQISLCVLYFTRENWRNVWVLLAFALLGFIQGWMTFDYAFLATLFAIPLFILFKKEYRVSWSSFISVGLLSGIPYTLSHVLHFLQVVSYKGSMDEAIKDFTGAAAHRAMNAAYDIHGANAKYDPKQIGPFTVAKDYLYRVAGRGKYLAINLMNFIWIILGLKFVKSLEFKKGWKIEFNISGTDLLALFASVVVSALWSIVMKQHAHIHGFIARHYYFCYLICCYLIVSRTKRLA